VGWKKNLFGRKNGVNIDIFKNLPNHLTPQPRIRFKSHKLKRKKNTSLYIYIEYKILIKFQLRKSREYVDN
jgi:hypothetical protein